MGTFAENLKRIREQSGLTQEQVAQKISVTRQAVSRWEQGRTEPDIETCISLAQVLSVSVEELMLGKEPSAYRHFQKKFLIGCICSMTLCVLLFLLLLTIAPYWKTQVNTTYKGAFAYFWIFELLVPMLQPALLGLFTGAFIRLFYPIEPGEQWRRMLLLCGVLLLLPAIVVLFDDLLANCISNWKAFIFHWLYVVTSKIPTMHSVLFRLFPFIAGVLVSFSVDEKA